MSFYSYLLPRCSAHLVLYMFYTLVMGVAKSTKNRGRNRFFNCCRPVNFNDDTIIKRSHAYKSKDPSLKRVRSQEKLDSMLAKDFTKNFRQSRKENVFCRSFSDALKYVFSETALVSLGENIEWNKRKLENFVQKMKNYWICMQLFLRYPFIDHNYYYYCLKLWAYDMHQSRTHYMLHSYQLSLDQSPGAP